jgi:16S rRNA (cytidine1402-2'-O)-methyltransferase
MIPGLYVVGMPIGNLDDVSARALATLREASGILCEDTRRTRILLDRYGIHTPLISYHKFNEASRVEETLNRIRGGAAMALVSDSGMPGVSDPGPRIVTACHEQGVPVTVVPGPSAVTAAVALAGFSGGGFLFEGFLPRKPGARRRRLEALLTSEIPVVLFESPYRLVALLEELSAVAGDRRLAVAREMTKKFEECLIGTAQELLGKLRDRTVKGEIVVVIEPIH